VFLLSIGLPIRTPASRFRDPLNKNSRPPTGITPSEGSAADLSYCPPRWYYGCGEGCDGAVFDLCAILYRKSGILHSRAFESGAFQSWGRFAHRPSNKHPERRRRMRFRAQKGLFSRPVTLRRAQCDFVQEVRPQSEMHSFESLKHRAKMKPLKRSSMVSGMGRGDPPQESIRVAQAGLAEEQVGK
jgi:hypothetical protein